MNQAVLQAEIAEARSKLAGDLESLIDMRPLPEVALKINTACNDEDFDTLELTTLIECDPVVSSKLLSVVNSSMYGYSREVSSIKQALVVLGRKKIAVLATTIASESIFDSGSTTQETQRKMYEHSLSCASMSLVLAGHVGGEVDPGTAFLAGMLHDIGKLTLLDVAPNAYQELLADNSLAESRFERESELFGVDHATIGDAFGCQWGLSTSICDAITDHHQQPDFNNITLTEVTSLANRLVKIWGIGQAPMEDECEDLASWLAEIPEEEREAMQLSANAHYLELKALLAG